MVQIGLKENGQCVDRNGNGVIDTSTGLGDIKPWPNLGGADTNGGVTTAEDECIIHYVRTAGTNVRTVAVDASNNVWVGGLGNRVHDCSTPMAMRWLAPRSTWAAAGMGVWWTPTAFCGRPRPTFSDTMLLRYVQPSIGAVPELRKLRLRTRDRHKRVHLAHELEHELCPEDLLRWGVGRHLWDLWGGR